MILRLALIGIDGGSWNVLMPLIKKGLLRNFETLLNKGVHGYLKSLIPPITGAVWLSMATGLNPGKTGVIDFLKCDQSFNLKFVNSEDYRDRSLWDFLSCLGHKVIILDWPMLYPAYPVNGYMVCSWGKSLSTYPKTLKKEINNLVGDYDIFVEYYFEKYDDLKVFFDDLYEAIEKKLKVSTYMLLKKKWDLFIDILSFTDWLQHRTWCYIDPNHPLHLKNKKYAEFCQKEFINCWKLADEYLGKVINVADDVIVISDHGFGPQWGVFNIAKWASDRGFLKEDAKTKVARKIVGMLLKFYETIYDRMNEKAKAIISKIKKLGEQLAETKMSSTAYDILYPKYDIKRSKVLLLDYTRSPYGAIHVNPFLSEKERNDTLQLLTRELKKLEQELKNVSVKIWLLKEIYNGDKLHLLPDIIFTINDGSCTIIKEPFKEFLYAEKTYSPRLSGSHRLYGIFAAYGSSFKKGIRIGNYVSPLDITPTVLYLFNAPIPKNVDGRILTETLKETLLKEKSPTYVDYLWYRTKIRILKYKHKLLSTKTER